MDSNRIAVKTVSEIFEPICLGHAQVDCPVHHHFGPGIYIREVFIPKGSFAIGHYQKTTHLNVFLQGVVTMVEDNGQTYKLTAPQIFVSPPGRKVGYIHEDLVWLNIYATDITDVATLEKIYLEKSPVWLQHQMVKMQQIADQEDYKNFLKEYKLTETVVRAESERTDDLANLPFGTYAICTDFSGIEGIGLFATANIAPDTVIAPARINGKRTIAGRYTNHSGNPNAIMKKIGDDIYLVSIKPLTGYSGGQLGTEITVDYRQVLKERGK